MYILDYSLLETTDKVRLLKIIKRTEKKIQRLKREMEHPNYKKTTCPTELTMLSCERDFLNMARLRYSLLFNDYKEGRLELSDINFFEKSSKIKNIKLTYGGVNRTSDTIEVDLSGNAPLFKSNFLQPNADKKMDKDTFLKLFNNLHIGEWRKNYHTKRFNISILDGEDWSLKIFYNDGKILEYGGCNAYPYNFERLEDLLLYQFR
ncbi:MAG: hypothetical protein J6V68_02515 [Clostridia bacterium]|nr:hypothetical protein [Clostridia bacterium]